MLILELFDKIAEIHDREFGTDDMSVSFYVGDVSYVFYAAEMYRQPGTWDVQFTGNRTTKIIGTGNEYVVFSTILQIMREMLQSYSVTQLVFSAAEPSRQKLYNRLVSKLLPTWNKSVNSEHGMFVVTSPDH